MNKVFAFGLLLVLSLSIVSAYQVNDTVPLSVRVQYDNGVSLSNIYVSACRLSVFNHDVDSFVLRNVSMTSSGAFHSYNFVPSMAGLYTASVLCSYFGDSSVYWFDFSVDALGVSGSGSNRGINPSGGSVLQSVFPVSGSIVPEHSSYTVNLLSDSVLSFPTSTYVDSRLSNVGSSSWKLLRDGDVLDSGSFTSTSDGVYMFSYDFVDLPVGEYQVAESFDGKILLVDVSVVSRSNDLSLISGLVTFDNGSVSVVKLGVLIFVVIFVVVAMVLLFRSLRKKPSVPRREFNNR